MSAILSSEDLNDFISPGVACIKPIETIPESGPSDTTVRLPDPAIQKLGDANLAQKRYEVTTEDKLAATEPAPAAQISLTDCLACSGCVTSAEAVLVSLQSHSEVLNTLDAHPSIEIPTERAHGISNHLASISNLPDKSAHDGRLFIASVSPQVRASLAATFDVSEKRAGRMIAQLLSGPSGLRSGGAHGSGFTWVIDTNVVRDAALVLAAEEVSLAMSENSSGPLLSSANDEEPAPVALTKPILTSACPGWICYAEKTHPHVLPHLSRLKSPQALTGTLLKSVLSRAYGIDPSAIWHLAVMPCFDKKLEASRAELTSAAWSPPISPSSAEPVRDVDCVITARELLQLAEARGLQFASLPRVPVEDFPPFPDPTLDTFLFPASGKTSSSPAAVDSLIPARAAGPSGGFLAHILTTLAASHPPGTTDIRIQRGRNADVVEYSLVSTTDDTVVARAARFYGFRNIQNLVRRLKPRKASRMPGAAPRRKGPMNGHGRAAASGEADYVYVEVMACPGGCTNGGGQIRAQEVTEIRAAAEGTTFTDHLAQGTKTGPEEQRQWLARVDEAYFSGSEGSTTDDEFESEPMDVDSGTISNGNRESYELSAAIHMDEDADVINGISQRRIWTVLRHWENLTGVPLKSLVLTDFREVESDVGKGKKAGDMERVAGLASSIGGGW